jgi:hypothetical protein
MTWHIELTDTFSGEANYSWVTRHIVESPSRRGAVQKFSRMSGMNWHKVYEYGEFARYDSKSGATCFFIEWVDGEGDQS